MNREPGPERLSPVDSPLSSSGMASPRVTVIIATYDYAEVLPYSIGSVLTQSFADLELWVVGDGCSDDSEKVVRAIDDPRVRWTNLPRNTGNQSGPVNEGMRLARGDVIAYLGHDDLWLPDHLGPLVQAIDEGADLAYAIGAMIDPDGRAHPRPLEPFEGALRISPTLVAHTRDLARRVGPWRAPDELTTEQDDDFFARVHAAGAVVRFVPRVSAVKLDAARRRNVYRDRPVHEQQAWTERIRHGALLELIDVQEARVEMLRTRALDAEPFHRVAFAFARALVRGPRAWLRRWRRKRQSQSGNGLPYFGDQQVDAMDEAERARAYRAFYERRRAFKGLAPLDGTGQNDALEPRSKDGLQRSIDGAS